MISRLVLVGIRTTVLKVVVRGTPLRISDNFSCWSLVSLAVMQKLNTDWTRWVFAVVVLGAVVFSIT